MAPLTLDLLRWDDSPRLQHHCGVCQTPLTSPHAIQTCIGEHVEPCESYHQQLHFIKQSHACTSCHTTTEMHRKRHRDIFIALNHVKEPEDSPEAVSAGIDKKKAKKCAVKEPSVCAADIITESNYAFVGIALYGTTEWEKSADISKSDGPLDAIGVHLLNAPSESKCKAGKSKKSRSLGKSFRRTSSGPCCKTLDPVAAIDPKIFQRLEIDVAQMQSWPKKRKNTLKKIAEIISEDMEIMAKEVQETQTRKEAFERYVSKKALENLDELHKQFSWSTGQIIKQPKA